MVRALREIGPTIAIGKPASLLPGAGAGRQYVEDSEWQDVVRRCLVTVHSPLLERRNPLNKSRWS
jgi:hypothetical protein